MDIKDIIKAADETFSRDEIEDKSFREFVMKVVNHQTGPKGPGMADVGPAKPTGYRYGVPH